MTLEISRTAETTGVKSMVNMQKEKGELWDVIYVI